MALTAARGRIDVGMALRTAVIMVLLLVAYYLAPLDRPLTIGTGVVFATVLLLLALILVIEVRRILASSHPLQQAVRTLIVGLPTFLIVFASAYSIIDAAQPGSFTESLSRTDSLYFTLTTFATVGYGDIAPKTELARVIVMIQMVLGLIVVGVVAKVVLGAVRVARERNTSPATAKIPEL